MDGNPCWAPIVVSRRDFSHRIFAVAHISVSVENRIMVTNSQILSFKWCNGSMSLYDSVVRLYDGT